LRWCSKVGIEEEAVVLDLEVLALFADASLAQGDELFALGEGTDGDRPFLESNWHRKGEKGGTYVGHPGRRTKTSSLASGWGHHRKAGPKTQIALDLHVFWQTVTAAAALKGTQAGPLEEGA
jgi:hypothetical protein